MAVLADGSEKVLMMGNRVNRYHWDSTSKGSCGHREYQYIANWNLRACLGRQKGYLPGGMIYFLCP